MAECEVLITIPECLDGLLLNPQVEVQDWLRRVRYAIFDEVHTLGEDNGGIVWERLLSMLSCPFLALSATLGNPQAFHSWLGSIQDTHNRTVHLIVHPTRWSDLYQYMYVPREDGAVKSDHLSFINIVREELPHKFITSIHPCASLPLGTGLKVSIGP